jgi:hypothetical protein
MAIIDSLSYQEAKRTGAISPLLAPRPRPRETIEFIIDSCSNQPRQLETIAKIISLILQAEPPIYQHYRIVIPVQIATETRQLIFPEFLAQELARTPDGNKPISTLRQFYHEHRNACNIVETDISQAYKFVYAKHALPLLKQDRDLCQRVVELANQFIIDHPVFLGGRSTTIEEFDDFCSRLAESLPRQEKMFHRAQQRLQMPHLKAKLLNVESSLVEAKIGGMASQSRKLFKDTSTLDRIFMQAMYAEPSLNHCIGHLPDFKEFRLDKGERAIESYLFRQRRGYDPNRVSVVVSEDIDARDTINSLRHRSKNTVIVVSNAGLLHAMNYLKANAIPEPSLPQPRPLTPQQQYETNPRNQRREAIAEGRAKAALHYPSKTDLHLPTESEWSRRLAELIKYGHWRQVSRDLPVAGR